MLRRWIDKKKLKRNSHALYGTVVARARDPRFFQQFDIPDTFDGRFEMLVMHLYLLHSRLKEEDDRARLVSQMVFDCFLNDMDGVLREIGVGDQVVPKRISKMVKVFYGRAGAFDGALAASGTEQDLAEVIDRNLFPDGDGEGRAAPLSRYMMQQIAHLSDKQAGEIIENRNVFREID